MKFLNVFLKENCKLDLCLLRWGTPLISVNVNFPEKQFTISYIVIWSEKTYLNRVKLENIAINRGNDQGKFQALVVPYIVNLDPHTLWKTDPIG